MIWPAEPALGVTFGQALYFLTVYEYLLIQAEKKKHTAIENNQGFNLIINNLNINLLLMNNLQFLMIHYFIFEQFTF